MTEQGDVDQCHIQQRRQERLEHDGVHVDGAAAVDDRRRMQREVEPRDDEDEERHGQEREQRVDGRGLPACAHRG